MGKDLEGAWNRRLFFFFKEKSRGSISQDHNSLRASPKLQKTLKTKRHFLNLACEVIYSLNFMPLKVTIHMFTVKMPTGLIKECFWATDSIIHSLYTVFSFYNMGEKNLKF